MSVLLRIADKKLDMARNQSAVCAEQTAMAGHDDLCAAPLADARSRTSREVRKAPKNGRQPTTALSGASGGRDDLLAAQGTPIIKKSTPSVRNRTDASDFSQPYLVRRVRGVIHGST
jgi:hypothetical protein